MKNHKSIWEVPYIVVDVETTGPKAEANRIIDIACIINYGGQSVSEFDSLVNPHQFIPPYIVNMTHISNEMVFTAPEAYTVFEQIQKLFEYPDAVFVAHNAQFDWSFVSNTFKREGIEIPDLEKLCTLKLSRRVLNKDLKKNVGSLAEYFGIRIKNRHRAYGDAFATSKILTELLEIAEREYNIKTVDELVTFHNKPVKSYNAPASTYKRLSEKLDKLPDVPGVYYYKAKDQSILYVGKAKSLKDRVKSYFSQGNISNKKVTEMLKKAYFLDWDITKTELSALLLESKRIKELTPPYNVMDRKYKDYPFIKITNSDFPKLELDYTVSDKNADYYGPFRSRYTVEDIIQSVEKQFKLRKCDGELKNSKKSRECFYYHIKKCSAPCMGLISKEDYMEEVKRVKYFLSSYSDGVLKTLENKMTALADNLEFEKAAQVKSKLFELKKVFSRKKLVPADVNHNHFIAFVPSANGNDKFADVIFVRSGKLVFEDTVGSKYDFDYLLEKIDDFYFTDNETSLDYSQQDVDEVKIISSWIFKYQPVSRFIYIDSDRQNTIDDLNKIKAEFDDYFNGIQSENDL